MACSRPMVESDVFDSKHQIGLSGNTVKPKLIITLGISWAIQFVSGMKNSDCIISINSDKNAPIFDVANYCVVGDMYEIVPKLIKSKASLTAIEYMSLDTIISAEDFLGKKFPDTNYEAYILLTFDGNSRQTIEEEYTKVAQLCIEHGAIDGYFVDTEERKKSVWSARGAFLEAIKALTDLMDECDVAVPKSKDADFIKYTHEVAKDVDIRIPSFGHAGDGNLHVYICKDNLPEDI